MVPRFSFHELYAPGSELEERMELVRSAGFDGIELDTATVRSDEGRRAARAVANAGMRVMSAVCGGLQGCLLSDDRAVRNLAVDDLRRLMSAAAQVGAGGVVFVPVIGAPRLPDLSPWKSAEAVHEGLLLSLLSHLVQETQGVPCELWLEPLNRYRTHYIQRLGQAVAICEQLGGGKVRVMGDTFHMALEEGDPARAIRDAGGYLAHMHLVDNNRKLPGTGSLDFGPIVEALGVQGYKGCLTFECPVDGDFATQLARARSFVERLCVSG